MLKEFFCVANALVFYLPADSSVVGGNIHTDISKVGGFRFAHLRECFMDSKIVIIDILSSPLCQFLEIRARCFGSKTWLVSGEEFVANLGPVAFIDVSVVERLPPDQGTVSQNHIEFLQLSCIRIPSCDFCRGRYPLDKITGRD